jgi:chromate reductase, NAD(P)H dehydrogenase (quinone)
MKSQLEVAMLVASTRKGSINERLARAVERTAPATLHFKRVHFDMLPFYNGDLEGNRPDSVNDFVNRIRQADAVCIVTPEYNRSIPAVLKNAIDWGSKPNDSNVWRDKVIAMTGASNGGIGTAVGQQHLRQILAILGAVVLPGEAYISFKTPDMIDADGSVSDDSVRNFIAGFASRFAKLAEHMQSP